MKTSLCNHFSVQRRCTYHFRVKTDVVETDAQCAYPFKIKVETLNYILLKSKAEDVIVINVKQYSYTF